jgi:hypothetical protein
MFATIVGGALALVFIGLPLAIIGLFIQSLLERRNKRPAASEVKSKHIGSEHSLARPGAACDEKAITTPMYAGRIYQTKKPHAGSPIYS